MPIAAYKQILAFKEEANPGIAEALANGDVIKVLSIQSKADLEVLERQYTDDVFSRSPHLVVGKRGSIDLEVDLCGNGNAQAPGAAPWAPLLKACGMKPDVTGLIWSFTTDPADYKTITLGSEHENGKLRLAGAMGTFSLSGEARKPGKAKFSFTGIWQLPVAQDQILTAAADIVPPTVQELKWNNVARKISKWGLDAGLDVALLQDTSAAGYYRAWLQGRKTTGSFDPEQVAGVDLWAEHYNATQRAMAITVGTAAGNKLAIAAGDCQIPTLSDGTRDGVRIFDASLAVNGASPFTITWS